jgi:hypothetical protein
LTYEDLRFYLSKDAQYYEIIDVMIVEYDKRAFDENKEMIAKWDELKNEN